jgi:DNA-binding IclR family transcriptional regulator
MRVNIMKNGEIRIKTLKKFLTLINLAREGRRNLTVAEISETIGCCKGHAYDYQKALKQLLPIII